jgi:hypothetical protein
MPKGSKLVYVGRTMDQITLFSPLTLFLEQFRWFVKLVSKVGYGRYSLGTVSDIDSG